jgi:hypothetical protein
VHLDHFADLLIVDRNDVIAFHQASLSLARVLYPFGKRVNHRE